MNIPVGPSVARSEQPAPVVLVPKLPGTSPAGAHRRNIWLIAGLLSLAVIIAVGAVWWLSSSGATVHYTTVAARAVRRARGHGDRHGQSRAHHHRRQLRFGRHPGALLRLQHPGKKGQICAKIDPRPYQTVVDQNKANLDVAKAQLEKDKAILDLRQAQRSTRRVLLTRRFRLQGRRRHRQERLRPGAGADRRSTRPTIEQRQAQLDAAQVNLDYTDIVSPVDGTVVSRNVTMGQTVAASFQTPTLFLIATDLTKMQVDTNVSESDIGGIKEGNKATSRSTLIPKRSLPGHGDPGPAVAADRAERRDLRRRGRRRQCRSGAEAGHDRRDPDRRRSARRRHARAEPGAALRAQRACRATPARRPAERAGSGCCATARPVALPVVAGLDDDNFTEIVKGDLKPGDQVIVAEQRSTAGSAVAPRLRSDRRAGAVSRPTMPEPIIRVENVTRTYHVGDVDVHALRGVSLTVEPGEFVAIMGSSGIGQIDADGDPRLPRPADQRPLFFRRRRRRRARRSRISRASAASGWASCSRASTCWRAPARSRTSRLPLFYAASGPVEPAERAERARARRWSCSASANANTTRRRSSPAASSSASPSRGP